MRTAQNPLTASSPHRLCIYYSQPLASIPQAVAAGGLVAAVTALRHNKCRFTPAAAVHAAFWKSSCASGPSPPPDSPAPTG
mmetsp:Transcript_9642/g.17365  ORF Transcript_9642/g.17365 Transcript_9642/m.17365 type:complete len:81 (-) Transcript_9642:732-974(-)